MGSLNEQSMVQRTFSLLLVDDEEANRLLLRRRLEQDGYLVTEAENGRKALEVMRVERFDLVLLDMYMPEMDGLSTLDAIMSDDTLRKVPVVMLTASNTREHVVHCLSMGAADYLIKPVNPVELKQRVRRCLEARAVQIEPTVRLQMRDITGARVLIVDDEPLNLKLVERRLAQIGLKTQSAEGGREALDLLGREAFDAVLLDINMPGMDGFEVLKAIRAREQGSLLPVFMLSAEDNKETVSRCYELGADDYLLKPFHTADLHARLAVALDLRRARQGQTRKAQPESSQSNSEQQPPGV
jgi:CheY-like chemotaxis protein